MRAGLLSRAIDFLTRKRAPEAPPEVPRSAVPMAEIEAAIKKSLAETTYPTPWQTYRDGRRFRLLGAQWVAGRGVVPEIEWEDQAGGASSDGALG